MFLHCGKYEHIVGKQRNWSLLILIRPFSAVYNFRYFCSWLKPCYAEEVQLSDFFRVRSPWVDVRYCLRGLRQEGHGRRGGTTLLLSGFQFLCLRCNKVRPAMAMTWLVIDPIMIFDWYQGDLYCYLCLWWWANKSSQS